MNQWDLKSCRACLLQDHETTMYDLAVPETMELFEECSNTRVTMLDASSNLPQHLCAMCFKMCELMQGFRDRCQETEKKLIRASRTSSSTRQKEMRSSEIVKKARMIPKDVEEEEEEEQEVDEQVEHEEQEVSRIPEEETTTTTEADLLFDQLEDDDDEDADDGPSRARKIFLPRPRKRAKAFKVPAHQLKFGPGPNTRGVWQYFQHDTTKRFAICSKCEVVLGTPNSTTTRLRNHLKFVHKIFPPRSTDYGDKSGEVQE